MKRDRGMHEKNAVEQPLQPDSSTKVGFSGRPLSLSLLITSYQFSLFLSTTTLQQ
jgi:hypothetical protein